MAPVLKTGDLQGSGGSNPSPSAKNELKTFILARFYVISLIFHNVNVIIKLGEIICKRN